MTERKKNPYPSQSPEWQLFEQAIAHDLLARGYAADADRAMLQAAAARESAEAYWIALEKLAPGLQRPAS